MSAIIRPLWMIDHLVKVLVRGLPADRFFPPLSRLVLETLGPLPPTRKCFRMINGVLVERTVKDVTPALQTNSEGLKKVLEELVKQYKKQQDEMENWKVSRASFQASIPGGSAYGTTSCRRKTIFRLYSSRPMVQLSHEQPGGQHSKLQDTDTISTPDAYDIESKESSRA